MIHIEGFERVRTQEIEKKEQEFNQKISTSSRDTSILKPIHMDFLSKCHGKELRPRDFTLIYKATLHGDSR